MWTTCLITKANISLCVSPLLCNPAFYWLDPSMYHCSPTSNRLPTRIWRTSATMTQSNTSIIWQGRALHIKGISVWKQESAEKHHVIKWVPKTPKTNHVFRWLRMLWFKNLLLSIAKTCGAKIFWTFSHFSGGLLRIINKFRPLVFIRMI